MSPRGAPPIRPAARVILRRTPCRAFVAALYRTASKRPPRRLRSVSLGAAQTSTKAAVECPALYKAQGDRPGRVRMLHRARSELRRLIRSARTNPLDSGTRSPPMDRRDDSESLYDRLSAYAASVEKGEAPPFDEWAARQPPRLAQTLRDGWSDLQRANAALGSATAAGSLQVLEPGVRLGPFVLVRELGRGGQAVVWEAEQPELGRRVALKLLQAGRVSERERALFRREARAGARLRHGNIVAVFDSGEAAGALPREVEPRSAGRGGAGRRGHRGYGAPHRRRRDSGHGTLEADTAIDPQVRHIPGARDDG
ncbi:MAG: hypothetical protein ACI841_004358 [Planctomycetota bacterium]|jgi:hypothetical protein